MCTVEGCEKPGRGAGNGMCEMHYMRMYRNGKTDRKITPKNIEHSGGYVLIPARGHALALGSSHHYEHRVVYYDAHGAGPFKCHWCGTDVTWNTLHIDHLDDNKKNNDVANLVPSCPTCNQSRGKHKIRKTWRSKTGLTVFGETLTLNEWAAKAGISRQSLISRLKSGWDIERAVTEGRGKTGPRSE